MSDNNATTGKLIFWLVVLTIGAVVFSCYLPILKSRINNMVVTEQKVEVESEVVNPSILFSFESSNCDIVIKSYADGIVFYSSDNYTIDVLKGDMGYILTPVELNSLLPDVYYFLGEGWYYLITYPIEIIPPVEIE